MRSFLQFLADAILDKKHLAAFQAGFLHIREDHFQGVEDEHDRAMGTNNPILVKLQSKAALRHAAYFTESRRGDVLVVRILNKAGTQALY